MKVLIASGVQAQLLAAAAEAAPEECCGLLLGSDFRIESAVAARNVAADPTRNFEIDPAVLLRTHREARGAGMNVLGVYHSHPNGVAEPSKTDAARAVENERIWLIIAGSTMTAWTTSPYVAPLVKKCTFGRVAFESRPKAGASWPRRNYHAPPIPIPTGLHGRFHLIPLETF